MEEKEEKAGPPKSSELVESIPDHLISVLIFRVRQMKGKRGEIRVRTGLSTIAQLNGGAGKEKRAQQGSDQAAIYLFQLY